MNNINNVTLSGNLVADAEERNNKVVTFSIACNEDRYDKQSEEYVEYANYFDCVIFGNYGVALAPNLTKGTKVCISGKLSQTRWEDEEENIHSRIQIIANSVEMLKPKDTKDKPKARKR